MLAIVPAWNEEKSVAEVLGGGAAGVRRGGADCILTHGPNRGFDIACRMPLARRRGNAFFRSLLQWLSSGWRIQDSRPGRFAVNRTRLDGFFPPCDCNRTR